MADYLIRLKDVPDDFEVNVSVEARTKDPTGKGSDAHFWNKIKLIEIPEDGGKGPLIDPTIEWHKTVGKTDRGYFKLVQR